MIKKFLKKSKVIRTIYSKILDKTRFVSGKKFIKTINENIEDCETILDLGCGQGSLINCNIKDKHVTGMDIFGDYLGTFQKNMKGYDKLINDNIMNIDKHFGPKSVDCIVMIEVIEHLSESMAKELLEKMEKISIKKIIIHTPNGFLKQEPYDGNEYQRHLSGRDVNFFKTHGYQKIYGMRGLKWLRGQHGQTVILPIIMDVISEITELFVYNIPKYAFQLLAIKNLKK